MPVQSRLVQHARYGTNCAKTKRNNDPLWPPEEKAEQSRTHQIVPECVGYKNETRYIYNQETKYIHTEANSNSRQDKDGDTTRAWTSIPIRGLYTSSYISVILSFAFSGCSLVPSHIYDFHDLALRVDLPCAHFPSVHDLDLRYSYVTTFHRNKSPD